MDQYTVEAISNGIAYGKAIYVNNDFIISEGLCSNTVLEKHLFLKSINEVIADLEALSNDEVFKDEDFLTVHIMILKDPTLTSEVNDLIENKRYHAEKAFDFVINKYIEKFNDAQSFYLQERNLDFKDIRNRVLTKLNHHLFKDVIDDKIILVCDELYPSLLMEYKKNVAGVISKKGGSTSHGAILCKAREIPFVLLEDKFIPDGSNIIIDTRKNVVIVDASLDLIDEYRNLKKQIKDDKPIDDFSKYHIKIMGNVSNNDDIPNIMKYDMYGVGLYRTEFIFMNLTAPLSYEKQLEIYEEAVESLNGKCITFRTFDIGDDKQLPYLTVSRKGINNYRNNRELFETQIRAIINANKYSNAKVMFPMIETYEEFKYLRDWTLNLKHKENNYSYLKIGMMLETKEALAHLDDFKDIDFMSIGTNDLSSELYNINRSEVIHYDSFIDDLINQISKIALHCQKYNIDLSICGEIAGIPEVVERLYKTGIKQYSISASNAKAIELAFKKCLNIK